MIAFSEKQMDVIRHYVTSTEDGRIHDYKCSNIPHSAHAQRDSQIKFEKAILWAEKNGISKDEWDDLVVKLARAG